MVDSVKESYAKAKRCTKVDWKVVPGHAGIYGNEVAHILADWGRRGFFSLELYNSLLPANVIGPREVIAPSTDPKTVAGLSPLLPEWLQFPSTKKATKGIVYVYGLGWQINSRVLWAAFVLFENKITFLG